MSYTPNPAQVKELRERTGAGMMDCKKALSENNGDFEKSIDYLRAKGLAAVAKKSGRIASEGMVGSYVHTNGKIGVLVEVNCETDFVARNTDFQDFVKDLCLHIAAANPQFLKADEMDENFRNREAEVYAAQLKEQGKPENMIANIVKGKLAKLASDVCLMEQPFVKDPDKKVGDLVNELTLKIGEKISVRRFIRYNLGEGLAKREDNLAEEVAKMTQQS